MRDFTTASGITIPGATMERVSERLLDDEDWQAVATDLLRPFIPDYDNDLDDVQEVLIEAERRAGISP